MQPPVPDGHTVIEQLRHVPGERVVYRTRRDGTECVTLVLFVPIPVHFTRTVQGVVRTGKGSIEGMPEELSRTLEGFRVRATLQGFPFLPEVHDAGVFAPAGIPGLPRGHGYAWVSTHWAPGRSVGAVLPQLAVPDQQRLLVEVVSGLAQLHESFVLHGDIKPENLIVGSQGLRFIDLETLRVVSAPDAPVRSLEYTPGFAAPEQQDRHEAYLASDVFAFGMVAATLLTGMSPDVALEALHGTTPIRGLPDAWRNVLRGCTAPYVAARSSAPEVAQQLGAILAGRSARRREAHTIRVADPTPPTAAEEAAEADAEQTIAERPRASEVPTVYTEDPPDRPIPEAPEVRRRSLLSRLARAAVWMVLALGVGMVGLVVVILAVIQLAPRWEDRRAESACRNGDLDACYRLAVDFEHGSESIGQALALHNKVCSGGRLRGCFALASLGDRYASGDGVPKDPVRAASAYRAACDGGAQVGCTALGLLQLDQVEVGADRDAAASLFLQACQGGQSEGCAALVDLVDATVMPQGDGVPDANDDAWGIARYQEVCDAGAEVGCAALVAFEAHRAEVAAAEMQADCAAGSRDRCTTLVDLALGHASGTGVGEDDAKAVALLRAACEAGDGRGCRAIGAMVLDGEGTDADPVAAGDWLERACRAQEPGGCTDLVALGLRFAEGTGIDEDDTQAARMFEKACDADVPAGCTELGIARRYGRGIDKDAALAASLFSSACDAGDPVACRTLGVLYWFGEGVVHNHATAEKYYAIACKKGDAEGCELAKK